MDKKLFGLSPTEVVRHDSRLKSEVNDAVSAKKAYLQNEEKIKPRRENMVNKQRRKFIDMVAKAGISSKVLQSSSLISGAFASRQVLAQGDFANKNIVFVYVSQGAPGDQWLGGNPGSLPDVSRAYADAGVADLMAFRHVDVNLGGHSSARQAMGDPQTQWHLHKPTVDMRIADVIGATSPYKMMYLGANSLMGMNTFSEPKELMLISDAGIPVDGPGNALNQFFNATPPIANDTGAEKMFDAHAAAMKSIKNKLGADEINRIDYHVDSLQALKARIVEDDNKEPFDVAACKPMAVDMMQETLNQGYGQADIIASALACGLTKVAVLQVGDNKAYYSMPGYFGGEVHGGGSHGSNPNDYLACCRGHQTVPAYMLKKLTETHGIDGKPLIDNTVFVVTNCMGNGVVHTPADSPWGIATKIPGFQTGFSSGGGGFCTDFMSAIPVGMGLPDDMYVNLGGNPGNANILA